MALVKINIDGKKFEAEEGENLLSFLLKNNFPIPHLCYHPDFEPEQDCRLCLVEVNGKIKTSCGVKIKEGLEIITNSEKIKKLRLTNIQLNALANKRKINRSSFQFSKIINFDIRKCIDCGLCIKACQNQEIGAIQFKNYGINQEIASTDNPCIFCGQCLVYCPANAISTDEKEYQRIKNNIKSKKIKIAQIAPSVRATIGELFGIPHEKITAERLVSALKKLGFDYVFDISFGADFTTVEEAKELIERLKEKKNLPLITSCCPGWVNYVLQYHSKIYSLLTTALPPHIISGNLIKHYFAKKNNLSLKDVYLVSIMPCAAKKWEIGRKELLVDGQAPVDDVLTTVETARLIKEEKIDFINLEEMPFDNPLGQASGAGVIYGTTGGVMTAALRTAYYFLTGKNPNDLYFEEKITAFSGIKTFKVQIDHYRLKIAIVNGLGNFSRIKDQLDHFDYIEVMACPGGCLAGGGQPKPVNNLIREKRKKVLMRLDEKDQIKFAHDNPLLKMVYNDFLTDNKTIKKICHIKH